MSILLLSALFPSAAFAAENEDFPEDAVKAKSAILMSLDTGEVLYAKNEKEHLSPASVTKIMTMLLVLEALDNGDITLNDTVTASSEAVSMGGSQIWLEEGESMTVEELFKAVVVASANDACTALAEYVGGSTTGFVEMMNERAATLGLKDTSFENCNGLDDTVTNHYSCAYDLAVIAREVMQHPLVTDYTSIWLDHLRGGKTELNNTNKLVNTYTGITGLKTGTTSNAGFCVAATAERDGMGLVAVILGAETSEDRFDAATNLLDYGFATYRLFTPEVDETQLTEVTVKQGMAKKVLPTYSVGSAILVKKGAEEISYQYDILSETEAPVTEGDVIGEIIIFSGDDEIGRMPLTAAKSVEKAELADIWRCIIINI